jgi:hypothetical protein
MLVGPSVAMNCKAFLPILVLVAACGGSTPPPAENAASSSTDTTPSGSGAQDMPPAPDTSASTPSPASTDTAAPSASAPAAAPPSPPPAVSKLKAADLKAAGKLAKPGDAYDGAFTKVTGKLGQPQRTDGDYSYWYAAAGKQCVEFQLQKQSDKVGAVGTQKYGKNDSVSLPSGGTFKPNDYCGLK